MEHALFTCSITRLFFKEENNIIWSMIRQIIKDNNLLITFHKIKAHSGDYAYDQTDQLTKDAHLLTSLLVTTKDQLQQIAVMPSWNNILIIKHLCHFIAKLFCNTGFE